MTWARILRMMHIEIQGMLQTAWTACRMTTLGSVGLGINCVFLMRPSIASRMVLMVWDDLLPVMAIKVQGMPHTVKSA